MLRALRPSGRTDCPNPVDKIDGYATKLNVDTTPTLVFADGGVLAPVRCSQGYRSIPERDAA
jgi:hypothetical protein